MKTHFFKNHPTWTQALLVGPCDLNPPRAVPPKTFVLFVDGGTRHQQTRYRKVTTSLSVGDNDSSRLHYGLTMDRLLSPEKNFSDLAFALSLLPKNITMIYFDGFFPALSKEKRFDHLLSNLGEIYAFLKKQKAKTILNDKMIFLPAGKSKIALKGTFSVFALETTKLKITGATKYKLLKPTSIQSLRSLTLSNVADGIVSFENSKPLLVITV